MDTEVNYRLELETHFQNILQVSKTVKLKTQQQLREKLRVFQSSTAGGVNPLLLFPEEIWLQILNHIDDPCDLINCAQTCHLFSKLLGIPDGQIVFFKVFPLLEKYLRNLSCEEKQNSVYSRHKYEEELHCQILKNCTKVSKFWKAAVIRCAEQMYSAQEPCTDIVEKIFTNVYPNVDDDDMGKHHDTKIPKQPRRSPRGYCGSSRHAPDTSYIKAISKLTLLGSPGLFEKYIAFLKKKGRLLKQLRLEGSANISPSSFYMVCHKALGHCPNLTGFCVSKWSAISWVADTREIKQALDRKPELCEHRHLKSFSFTIESKKSLPIQDKLLSKYSKQLSFVQVGFWNFELYRNLCWENLKHLWIFYANTEMLLNGLLNLQADQLAILNIKLDQSNHRLESLIKVINNFPKLRVLKLGIGTDFLGWSDLEILELPAELAGKNLVTELEITSEGFEMCHNFLICFPAVRKLVLNYRSRVFLGDCDWEEYDLGYPKCYIKNDPVFLGEEEPDIIPPVNTDDEDESDDWCVPATGGIKRPRDLDSQDDDTEEEDKNRNEDEENSDQNSNESQKENTTENKDSDADEEEYLESTEEDEFSKDDMVLENGPLRKNLTTKAEGNNKYSETKIFDKDISKDEDDTCSESDNYSDESKYISKIKLPTENDFIVISKFFWEFGRKPDEIKRMYRSNIWKVFPWLETVVLVGDPRETEPCVYTKRGYDHWKNKNVLLSRHYELILQNNKVNGLKRKLNARRKLAYIKKSTFKKRFRSPTDIVLKTGFRMVLPLVSTYLDISNVLLLRLVCKAWRAGVNHYLVNREDKLWFKFSVPFKPSQEKKGHNKYLSEMDRHPRNPLTGGSVNIILKNTKAHSPRLLHDLLCLLKIVGCHVAHFKITSAKRAQPLSPQMFNDICTLVAENCLQIQSLSLLEVAVSWERNGYLNMEKPPRLVLDSLEINAIDYYEYMRMNQMVSRDHLKVLKTSRLLNGKFTFLAELHFGKSVCLDQRHNLSTSKELNAPNLKHLSCHFYHTYTVSTLLNVINQFPKLTVLELYTYKLFHGLRCDTLMNLNPKLISTITDFRFWVTDKFRMSLDFLLHFPNLANLRVMHGDWATRWPDPYINANKDRINESLKSYESERVPYEDYIQLAKYLPENSVNPCGENVFQSNIWEILTKLQKVEVEQYAAEKGVVFRNFYLKNDYENYKMCSTKKS